MESYHRVAGDRPWAPVVGYSRAVRVGNLIEVAGTSSTRPDGSVVAPGDPYGQTKAILETITTALKELGAAERDVVRTRVFLTDVRQWEDVARAHGEVFGSVLPASTFVEVSRLMLPELVVEIEATAYLGDSPRGA